MNVIGFTESGSIRIDIDGAEMLVPDDMSNRHRVMIAGWEAAGNAIPDYEPPQLPPLASLTRRQLRLGLLANGISTADVEAAIAAIPDAMDRAVAEIEWADASQFERDHHLIEMIGTTLGMTVEQIDSAWLAAQEL